MTYDGRALVSRLLKAKVEPSRVVLVWRKNTELTKPAVQFRLLCHEFFGLLRLVERSTRWPIPALSMALNTANFYTENLQWRIQKLF